MKKNFLLRILIVIAILTVSIVFFTFSQAESQTKGAVDVKAVEKIREYQRKDDLDTAIKEANAYLASAPNDTEVLIRLAECYTSKGNLSLAEEAIEKVLEINMEDPWALRVSARIHREQFEKTKDEKYLRLAQIEIEKSLKFRPSDLWANGEAALIYYLKNDKINAMQAIDKALKLEPQNAYFEDIKKRIQDMP